MLFVNCEEDYELSNNISIEVVNHKKDKIETIYPCQVLTNKTEEPTNNTEEPTENTEETTNTTEEPINNTEEISKSNILFS